LKHLININDTYGQTAKDLFLRAYLVQVSVGLVKCK